jgi:hypothetical protein
MMGIDAAYTHGSQRGAPMHHTAELVESADTLQLHVATGQY